MHGAERGAEPAVGAQPETAQPGAGELRIETVLIDAARAMIAARREPLQYGSETTSIEELQRRARGLGGLLEATVAQHTQLRAHRLSRRTTYSALNEAIDTGDFDAQAQLGIDLRGMRFDTLVQAVTLGRPLEFQMASHAFEWQLPLNSIYDTTRQINDTERVTLRAHELFRRMAVRANGSIRTNTLTIYDPEFTSADIAASHVIETVMALRNAGIILPRDVVGRDTYVKLHDQGNIDQMRPLLTALERSPYGTVMRPEDPTAPDDYSSLVTFMPHPQYLGYAAKLAGMAPEYIKRTGLPLYLPGFAFDTALLALDSLTKDPHALRITFENGENASWYRQAAALTRFASNTGMELSQVIYHSGTPTAAGLIQKALARALLPHMYQFERNLGRFSNPARYTASEYFGHNYGPEVQREQELLQEEVIIPGMLNEDFHCRSLVVKELYWRFKPKQFTTMYDAYCGPGSSLARIVEPYICDKRDGGSIKLIDLSPSSIAFQEQWIAGTLDPTQARVADLDQQLFDRTEAVVRYSEYDDNARKVTADQRARSLAETYLADFDQLEPLSCDVITDGYGTCSSGRPLVDGEVDPIPPSFEDFCVKQKQKYAILRPGGAAISMHMVRRTNWNSIDQDTQQPLELSSVYLASKDEIERAYMDAGFVDVFCQIVTVAKPHHANVAAGESEAADADASSVAMAVVVAQKL